MTIFKIKQLTGKNVSDIKLTRYEIEEMAKLEYNEIVLEDDGTTVIGIFSDRFVDFTISLFKKYDIPYQITDVTNHYLKSTSLFNQFMEKYKMHKTVITEAYSSSTTINDVLDKISEFGIESLNEIDKQILNK